MSILLNNKQFQYAIRRKTPCLISIEDKLDVLNIHIHHSINNLCKEFPLVLCYKIPINDYINYHLSKSIYSPQNLICFEMAMIKSVVDANNYWEMYKLFWQVYADSCAKSLKGYMKILCSENRNNIINFQLYMNEADIEIFGKHEGGIIEQCTNVENFKFPKPLFLDQKSKQSNTVKKRCLNHLKMIPSSHIRNSFDRNISDAKFNRRNINSQGDNNQIHSIIYNLKSTKDELKMFSSSRINIKNSLSRSILDKNNQNCCLKSELKNKLKNKIMNRSLKNINTSE